MAMATCYSYDHMSSTHSQQHQSSQHQQQSQMLSMSMHPASSTRLVAGSQQHMQQSSNQQQQTRDYSIPLHVDCSVEYELPNQAKPPVGARVEPLLMIHPCYFRKMESQRRSPFVNNMPNSTRSSSSSAAASVSSSGIGSSPSASTASSGASRRSNRLSAQPLTLGSSQRTQPQTPQHMLQATHQHQHNHHQQHQQNQQLQIQQQLVQHSQMSQQAHYPVVSSAAAAQQQHSHTHSMQHQQLHQQQSSTSSQYGVDHQHQSPPHQQPQLHTSANSRRAAVIHCRNAATNPNQSQTHQSQVQITSSSTSSSATAWDQIQAQQQSSAIGSSNSMAGLPSSLTGGHIGLTAGSSMYSKPLTSSSASKRMNTDPMLSGGGAGCSLFGGANLSSNGRWEPERSPMAAIPRDYQAGPDSQSPIGSSMLMANITSSSSANNNNSSMNSNHHSMSSNSLHHLHHPHHRSSSSSMHDDSSLSIGSAKLHHHHQHAHHHQQPQQQHQPQHQSLGQHTQSIHQQQQQQQQQQQHHQALSGKYRQYLRSHRLHPYIMSGSSATGAAAYPQLNSSAFPTMQQVSCYNV